MIIIIGWILDIFRKLMFPIAFGIYYLWKIIMFLKIPKKNFKKQYNNYNSKINLIASALSYLIIVSGFFYLFLKFVNVL